MSLAWLLLLLLVLVGAAREENRFIWGKRNQGIRNVSRVRGRDDPADSWLAYGIAHGRGRLVTLVNTTWKVPSYPSVRTGSNAPGWWFGIEPITMDDLIQPILAYGDTFENIFTIFNGRYTWDTGRWWQSRSGEVKPGDTIVSYLKWLPEQRSYEMYISCKETGWSVTSLQRVQTDQVFSNVVFVTEHQPDTCSAYPVNGKLTFEEITIAWQNDISKDPLWQAHEFQPACNCTAKIVDNKTIAFTWTP